MKGKVLKFPGKQISPRCRGCQKVLRLYEYTLCKSCLSYELMYRDAMSPSKDEEASH